MTIAGLCFEHPDTNKQTKPQTHTKQTNKQTNKTANRITSIWKLIIMVVSSVLGTHFI